MAVQLNNSQPCLDSVSSNDLNQTLRDEARGIFDKELKTDTETATIITGSFGSDKNKRSKEVNIPNAQWFEEYAKKLHALSSPIIFEYHKSEIDNVNNIIKNILSILKWISFLTIVLVAVFAYLDKDIGAIVSGIAGGVIDVILGILISLFNSTLKSKKSYFDSENDSMRLDKMFLIVQTIANQEKKDLIIEDIVRKHFDILTKQQGH